MDSKEILRRVKEAETGVVEEEGKRVDKASWIAPLIGIGISIVVGVNLIPPLVKSLKESGGEMSSGAEGLVDFLPYVLVAMTIVGALAWISGIGKGKEVYEEVEELSEVDKIRQLQGKRLKQVIYRGD